MIRVLVAGIGNIFMGDDGFGVEVVQQLAKRDLPPGVRAVDFGVRGIDLTFALLNGCEAAVLVDTALRGGAPGDLYVIEPEVDDQAPAPEDLTISGHDLDPVKVLRVVRAMDGACRRILLVACEPLTFGGEEGAMGLSPPVAASVSTAQGLIEGVVRQLQEAEAVP